MLTPKHFRERGPLFWLFVGSVCVAGIGAADILTGGELAFALFYLIPIVMVTWFSGQWLGLVVSLGCTGMWFLADVWAGTSYSQPAIRYWNAAMRLGFFVVVTLLLPALKAVEREKGVARIDALTGAANRRHFFEALHSELDRAQRYGHPFTLAYIDLDGFKAVNDHWGHRMGDKALCAVVDRAKRQLRRTDLLARLGGDEFIILLPETDPAEAQVVVSKLGTALMDAMRQHQWPVTFSIGVLTCLDAKFTPDELVQRADAVMYSVKKNGKDAIAYAVCSG
jgi:diguanylate cyclase (GGDEF)-like protein